jgi:hypothetical protein
MLERHRSRAALMREADYDIAHVDWDAMAAGDEFALTSDARRLRARDRREQASRRARATRMRAREENR